jgi:hypothetical protein
MVTTHYIALTSGTRPGAALSLRRDPGPAGSSQIAIRSWHADENLA